jgi:hypothetical protein
MRWGGSRLITSPANATLPALGLSSPQNPAQDRGLPRAVGTDQTHDPARIDGKVDTLDRDDFAVGQYKPANR